MRKRTLLAALPIVTAISCGASIQAVYEGDVRFEHCMALDARPDMKPTIRSACWDEWLRFYTYGQTRDRIDHARLREKQLLATSDFDEVESQKSTGLSAVPDPTSVLAPPPMLLAPDAGPVDAGASAQGSPADAADERPPPSAECAAECEQSWNFCRQQCKTAPCEKACSAKYKKCMKRCF